MEELCENCVKWSEWKVRPDYGDCSSEKFVYLNDTPEDGLMYWDREEYGADFLTGKKFGCIHFQPRK